MKILSALLTITMISFAAAVNGASTETPATCPDFLNHNYRKLHSTEMINLCALYQEKPILLVNTASHCGFTRQFKPLEALYQKYKDQGVEVIGFASDDFNQEAKDEAKAASVCYKNYGVTFTMLAPTHVKGKNANPTFAYLAEKTKAPSWNFNKYLVNKADVYRAGASTKPLGSSLEKQLQQMLAK